jgi:uncharacterized phage protein (TIGR02220 family)
LAELSRIHFLTRDDKSEWVLIGNFLKYHPIENPNQAKSIEAIFNKVPCGLFFIPQLVTSLLRQEKHFRASFLNCLETLAKPFQNQKQKQDQKQKQKIKDMSGKPDPVSLPNTSKSQQAVFESQALEVLNFLNEKTGRAYRPVDTNIKLIVSRLKSGVTVMDCRQIIAKKTREWKDNPKMSIYIRPATLFNSEKFEQYMGELVIPKEDDVTDELI